MPALTREEKLKLMRSINWDYNATPEDMLDVIEGYRDSAGAFDREGLFVRSLERLSWYHIVELFGVDLMIRLWTPELARRLRSKEMRKDYDYAISILRGKPLPTPEWGVRNYRPVRNPFLPNRWYSLK
jgi:hypothetical protein